METLATHYSRLLGTDDSWRVESVDLRLEDRRVEIRLKHVGSGVSCPECGRACGLADHAEERRWRHLNTMQFTTVHIRRPSMVLGVEDIPLHVLSLLLVVSLVLVKPEAVEVRILHGEADSDRPARQRGKVGHALPLHLGAHRVRLERDRVRQGVSGDGRTGVGVEQYRLERAGLGGGVHIERLAAQREERVSAT